MTEKDTSSAQRPDLGIETIMPAEMTMASRETFPWLATDAMEVPTVSVRLEDGTTFRYGSLVGGNSGIEKLADEVPAQQSLNAEQGMFKALAALLNGQRATSVDRMTQYVASDLPVYKTAKKGSDVARLYFALSTDEAGSPLIFKIGVAKHKKQDSLFAILKGNPGDRHKRDGKKK